MTYKAHMVECARVYLADLTQRNASVRAAAAEAGMCTQALYKLLERHGLHARKPVQKCKGNTAWQALGE